MTISSSNLNILITSPWSDFSAEEAAPWVAAIVTFVFMAMAVALVVVAVVYRERISNFLCPKDALPQHFKEVCMFISICLYLCVYTVVSKD